MSVAGTFEHFCKNLEMDSTRRLMIGNRLVQIENFLNQKVTMGYGNGSVILWSSYGRETACRFVHHIRFLYALPFRLYPIYKDNPEKLINDFLTALNQLDASVFVSKNGKGLILDFYDGYMFEVIPSFEMEGYSMQFPDESKEGGWNRLGVRNELASVQYMNSISNSNYQRVCRMLRAWVNTNCVNLHGILLDTLVFNFMMNYQYRDKSYSYYDWVLRDLFKYLSKVDVAIPIEAMGSRRKLICDSQLLIQADTAYKCMDKVCQSFAEDEKNCIKQLRQLFGYTFPKQ